MLFSLVPPNDPSRSPNLPSSDFRSRFNRVNIPWRFIAICCGSQVGLISALTARAEQQPQARAVPIDPEEENQDDKRVAKSKENNADGLPNFTIPEMPPWAKLILGSLFLLALPFYKKFLDIEDEIEETTTTALEVVEEVAEEVAEYVEKSLPENSSLRKLAEKVEQVAEEVDKDAEKLETIVKKVDGMVDKVDAMVEQIIEGNIAAVGSKSTKEK